ncbi:MAG: hypothetical protein AAF633_26245 [Chloroflexota bacterium]
MSFKFRPQLLFFVPLSAINPHMATADALCSPKTDEETEESSDIEQMLPSLQTC